MTVYSLPGVTAEIGMYFVSTFLDVKTIFFCSTRALVLSLGEVAAMVLLWGQMQYGLT
ncbi:hypothetical protein [Leptothoe sp. PORK10 BA2]|uniref:hypothetical protein n=1 Tax=Leptothoe sp. PORK10 BA2 TaxID=3110254 RepID=UPI002B1EBC94|nr:hypothetical protein [Leptothoe sp. PORK10 BA2]